jgi:hypothetical protein
MPQETQKSKEKAITEIRCMVQEQDRLRREIQQYRYDKKKWAKVLQGLLILIYLMHADPDPAFSPENTDILLDLNSEAQNNVLCWKQCSFVS